jgi:histidinol dehydrogenase
LTFPDQYGKFKSKIKLAIIDKTGAIMRILNTKTQKELIFKLLDRRAKFQNQSLRDLTSGVARIIADVKERGDLALCDYTARFDKALLTPAKIRVTEAEIAQAVQSVPAEFGAAIRQAKDNIVSFHRKQLPRDWLDLKEDGIILGQRYQPVSAAGLYVPGGTAGSTPLVSSLLMNALPAKVAGVSRIIICTPPNTSGSVNPYLLAAAAECEIAEIYKAGSAWAIAAMAYGTATIPGVDVIVGPGNQYVTEAKRQVFGYVGLDMLAGPSEILIIADADNDPAFIAADLLSQAEHGPVDEAGSFFLTPSDELAKEVATEIDRQLIHLTRQTVAAACIEASGGIIITASLDEAIDLANFAAPEHLELMVREPWSNICKIKNAGAIFIGPYSTEPIGDYVAGTNHVLPTNGTSRFASGLNVDHFIKKSSIISYNKTGIIKYGQAAITIAGVEGLDAHANAVKLRLDHKE